MMRSVSIHSALIIKKGDESMPTQIVTKKDAYEAGGYRERYAMDNGTMEIRTVSGHRLWIFRYSKDNPYQDGNGATFDCKTKTWIN